MDADADDVARDAARGWLARSWELVHPYGSGGVMNSLVKICWALASVSP